MRARCEGAEQPVGRGESRLHEVGQRADRDEAVRRLGSDVEGGVLESDSRRVRVREHLRVVLAQAVYDDPRR